MEKALLNLPEKFLNDEDFALSEKDYVFAGYAAELKGIPLVFMKGKSFDIKDNLVTHKDTQSSPGQNGGPLYHLND